MKIVFLADLHIKNWTDEKFVDNNIPLKLHEILSCVKQAIEYSLNNSIKKIVIAGDTNDLKNIVHYDAFILFKKLISSYSDKIQFVFLSGNHDESSLDTKSSSIELFSDMNNVKVIFKDEYIEDNITYVPWNSKIKEKIQNINKNDILVAHFGLTEAQLVSDLSIVSPISFKDLKKFKLVILGHYHKPQQVGHVWYVGSPIQLRRSETGEEKRFLVVDTNTLDVESIPFTGYRKYFEFIIDNIDKKSDIINQANKYISEGHFVTVKDKIGAFNQDEKHEGIVVVDQTEQDYTQRGITLQMSFDEQATKWMEIKEIDPKSFKDYLEICKKAISGNTEK